jgi:FkbM family methyltransferase
MCADKWEIEMILEIEPKMIKSRELEFLNYSSRKRIQMIHGQELALRQGDEYSRTLFVYRRQHISLLIGLSRFDFNSLSSQQKVTCLDIGANLGYVSAYLAMRSDVNQIHSFEPNHETFQILKINSMYYEKITPHQMLVSQSSGLGFHLPNLVNSAHSRTGSGEDFPKHAQKSKSVSMTSIDDFVEKNRLDIHFIKIDVEGHETEVIEGAKKTIASKTPLVLLELIGNEVHRERLVSQVKSTFFRHDFPVYQILMADHDGYLHQLEIEELLSTNVTDVFLVPERCNFRD